MVDRPGEEMPSYKLGRDALMMLAAATIPLSIGALVQYNQMLGAPAPVCPAPVMAAATPIVEVVTVRVPVLADSSLDAVPDTLWDEPVTGEPRPMSLPHAGPGAELPAGAFAFVVDLDGPHIVLVGEAPDTWEASGPRVETPGRATASLHRDSLPAEIRALVGKEVTLYDDEGKQGIGWIGQPRIVAQADGELGELDTYAAWELFENEDTRVEVEEDYGLAREIWETGRHIVVAPLDTQVTGRWARLSSLPTPRVLEAQDVPADVVEEEIPWAWQDPAVLDWSGGYALFAAEDGRAEAVDLSEMIGGTRWSDDDGVGMVTFVVYDPDSDACGGYADSVWGAAERGSRERKQSGVPGHYGLSPEAVFDVNGDGYLDVLVPGRDEVSHQLLLGTPDGFEVAAELAAVPFFGCPC